MCKKGREIRARRWDSQGVGQVLSRTVRPRHLGGRAPSTPVRSPSVALLVTSKAPVSRENISGHRHFPLGTVTASSADSKPALRLPKGAGRVAFSLHNQWDTIDRRDGALRCLGTVPPESAD